MDLLPYEPYEPYTAAVQDALEGCFTGKCHACINQSINVTPVAMKLKKLMPAIH
jgi:hypothetical protein